MSKHSLYGPAGGQTPGPPLSGGMPSRSVNDAMGKERSGPPGVSMPAGPRGKM
jgi:hypothetical protein